jgi:hypothetical protein
MKHGARALLAMVLATTACTVASDDSSDQPLSVEVSAYPARPDGPGDPELTPGPTVTRDFAESDEDILNPERGYYVGYDLRAAGDAGRVRTGGRSLAIALVRLDAYRDAPLDAALLDGITRGFTAARAAGIKVVLRFTYNSSETADASRARILGHIDQLEPILRANADVIAVLQAGFIGAWGEWHSSTNGLDNPTDRGAILNALLAALPTTRQVQVRKPTFKDTAFPGGPLTEAEAYAGTARARVAHHNDCFLASATDLGTYNSPIAQWMAYVDDDSRYTAVGGETCLVYPARSDCGPALAELTAKHWSYLNAEYNTAVLAGWTTGGCAAEIKRRLGYRFVLTRATFTEAIAPGGELVVSFDVKNRGFAAPFNRRPVEVVLTRGDVRMVARLSSIDARRWAAGETSSVTARLRVPATLAAGDYTLAVRLPDESSSLARDARYAIRFANQDMWSESDGDNVLTRELVIDPAAPGPRSTGATEFAELP